MHRTLSGGSQKYTWCVLQTLGHSAAVHPSRYRLTCLLEWWSAVSYPWETSSLCHWTWRYSYDYRKPSLLLLPHNVPHKWFTRLPLVELAPMSYSFFLLVLPFFYTIRPKLIHLCLCKEWSTEENWADKKFMNEVFSYFFQWHWVLAEFIFINIKLQ